MSVETQERHRRDTPTMRLVAELLRQEGHESLREYLEWARTQTNEDGTKWTWDDIAFDVRTKTGQRVVRESIRQWADRYGLLPAKAEGEDTPAEG